MLSRVGVHAHEQEFCMKMYDELNKPWGKKRPNALPLFYNQDFTSAFLFLFGKYSCDFSAAQRPLQVARGYRCVCTVVRFRVFGLIWAAELYAVLATFSRFCPKLLLFFRGWAGMVPPGQPSKPRSQQKIPHRERWIASWGTFCVPKTKRLVGN